LGWLVIKTAVSIRGNGGFFIALAPSQKAAHCTKGGKRNCSKDNVFGVLRDWKEILEKVF